MSNFRRTFKPTKNEQLENELFYYHLLMLSKEMKDCSTCKNKKIEEFYCIGGVKDIEVKCKYNLQNDICEKYEYDDIAVKEIISNIKKICKEIED